MRLRFEVDEAGAEGRWRVTPRFAGLPGVLHGGAVLALCDDAMWYAAFGHGALTMTAEASVRFRAPVEVGSLVVVRGWVLRQRGRLWTCAAELRAGAADGRLLASAEGKFLPAPAHVAAGSVHEAPRPGEADPDPPGGPSSPPPPLSSPRPDRPRCAAAAPGSSG